MRSGIWWKHISTGRIFYERRKQVIYDNDSPFVYTDKGSIALGSLVPENKQIEIVISREEIVKLLYEAVLSFKKCNSKR